MVLFQKLTRNLFLTLHGYNEHHQQQQLSKFLICCQQFTSHAYCGASFQDGVAAEKAMCVLRFEVSKCVITVQREFHARFRIDAPYSVLAIDNIFIDTTKIDAYEVIPAMIGLSDHNAQIINLNLNTMFNNKSHEYQTYFKRNINRCTMAEFQNNLSYESWDQFLMVMMLIKFLSPFWTLT